MAPATTYNTNNHSQNQENVGIGIVGPEKKDGKNFTSRLENNQDESLIIQNKEPKLKLISEGENVKKPLNLQRCRKILEQYGTKYTDEEILKIKKLLYKLANLDYELFKTLKKNHNDKHNHLRKRTNGKIHNPIQEYILPKRKAG